MIEHCETSILISSLCVCSLCAKTSLNTKLLVFLLDESDAVTAEQHLLLSKSILKKLVRCNLYFVAKHRNKHVDDCLVEFQIIKMDDVWINSF